MNHSEKAVIRRQLWLRWLIIVMLIVAAIAGGRGWISHRRLAIAQAPAPGKVVAFSLLAAEQSLRAGDPSSNIRSMGGITQLFGLVHDPGTNDLILIGRIDPIRPRLSLDDLVVAIRSVFARKGWPAVSIDRTVQTRLTRRQNVRLEGGIENCNFGRQMTEADVVLKRLALGLLPMDNIGASYLDRAVQAIQRPEGSKQIGSRFWFLPTSQSLVQREDVFAITDLQIGLETQVLSVNGKAVTARNTVRDGIGDAFAECLSAQFRTLCVRYPEIARLKSLLDITAIARGIQTLSTAGTPPDLRFWLQLYKVPCEPTLKDFPLLVNSARVVVNGKRCRLELDGGIELKALILRLHSGDITALRQLVLKSRPSPLTTCWAVPVADWKLPGMAETSSLCSSDESRTDVTGLGASVSRSVVPENSTDVSSDDTSAPPLPEREPQIIAQAKLSTDNLITRPTMVEQQKTVVATTVSSFGFGGLSDGNTYFGTAVLDSPDGRLRARLKWEEGDHIHARAVSFWVVYDALHDGKPLLATLTTPDLLQGGKIGLLDRSGEIQNDRTVPDIFDPVLAKINQSYFNKERPVITGQNGAKYIGYDADEIYRDRYTGDNAGQSKFFEARYGTEKVNTVTTTVASQATQTTTPSKTVTTNQPPQPALTDPTSASIAPIQRSGRTRVSPMDAGAPAQSQLPDGGGRGGVLISPNPLVSRRAGQQERQSVINSRPSKASLTWSVNSNDFRR